MDLAPPTAGPRRALVATPPAVPGSVRRTTSIDVTRPEGLLGPAVAVLAGRDRAVDARGRARVRAEVSLAVRVAVSGDVEGIDGGEVALHEYAIEADVDGDGRISRVEVDPRVLPWDACPGAVASASRMLGVAVADLPARVRAELVGPSTCTHLNSTLRCLADVDALRPGPG